MNNLNTTSLLDTEELLLLESQEVYARIPQLYQEYVQAFDNLKKAIVDRDLEAQKKWFDECTRLKQEQIDAGNFFRRYAVKKAYHREHQR